MEELKQVLEQIFRRQGYVRPQDVVEEASSETSPIHDLFEWDDTKAAEEYRIWQARALIAKVKIIISDRKVDAYHNVKITIGDENIQGYVSTETIISNKQLHEQVIKNAVNEIQYWKNKYDEVSELSGIVNDDKLIKVKERISNEIS